MGLLPYAKSYVHTFRLLTITLRSIMPATPPAVPGGSEYWLAPGFQACPTSNPSSIPTQRPSALPRSGDGSRGAQRAEYRTEAAHDTEMLSAL